MTAALGEETLAQVKKEIPLGRLGDPRTWPTPCCFWPARPPVSLPGTS